MIAILKQDVVAIVKIVSVLQMRYDITFVIFSVDMYDNFSGVGLCLFFCFEGNAKC
jgi:predicted enzyme involved in methoxymalonyl-ACP biosynthesis